MAPVAPMPLKVTGARHPWHPHYKGPDCCSYLLTSFKVIGRVKRRWPALKSGLRYPSMAKCSKAILVYLALYNFILKHGSSEDDISDEEDDEEFTPFETHEHPPFVPLTAHCPPEYPANYKGKKEKKIATRDRILDAYIPKKNLR